MEHGMTEAVQLTEHGGGVVQITMQDRSEKNTFSHALVGGLIEVYARIAARPDYKAVVLTGYDTYFASGGTQQGLLAIHEGKMTFADVNMYSLALDCPIPVVAAMQGHGIGGGFVMGLYSDIVLLSRESIYTTNFMKYGFTPGMGATAVVPYRLGETLAHEMLMTAANFRGAELERRGVACQVLPRAEVLPRALDIAAGLAQKPREALVLLKRHMTRALRERLPQCISEEIAMHEHTFHQQAVADRIATAFGR
ncbi:enoyl-CoA hydratase [Massilia sp. NR 4-1]|nr:enoyl-CoA hydratase [Massilia sp. NR 4-1]